MTLQLTYRYYLSLSKIENNYVRKNYVKIKKTKVKQPKKRKKKLRRKLNPKPSTC